MGVHITSTTARTVFVYDVASATVLAARSLAAATPVLAVSPDGSRMFSGQTLLETRDPDRVGNTEHHQFALRFSHRRQLQHPSTAQGGAVLSPRWNAALRRLQRGSGQNPAALANTSQLVFNTPDNLLIQLGLQLKENVNGAMVISSDGGTIYALSQSGFMVLPLGTIQTTTPIAVPDSNVALLASDQCGVTAAQNSAVIPVRNAGGGSRMTVTAQLVSSTATSTTVTAASRSYGADITARFNSAAARTLGTAAPDQLLIQSAEAVNIIPYVRVFQNSRNSEAAGTIVPVDVGNSTTGLTDMVMDTLRRRLYLANPGLNRIEIFDIQGQQLLAPINVGQLPRAMALSGDGNTLYVANNGGENVSVVNPTNNAVTTVRFPPLPFNSNVAVITPLSIASTEHGVQVLMSNGSMWSIVGASLVPGACQPGDLRNRDHGDGANQQLAASTDGSDMLPLAGNGTAYLYSATDDDSCGRLRWSRRSRTTSARWRRVRADRITWWMTRSHSSSLISSGTSATVTGGGPVTVGPGGGAFPVPTGPTVTTTGATRPISAVAAVGSSNYVRFSTPLRTSATAAVTDAGLVEVVDVATGRTLASALALEGPLTQVTGVTRVNTNGRTMALDSTGGAAYVLTASGLSVIPVNLTGAPNPPPAVAPNGVVNTASFRTGVAPDGLISIFGVNLASTRRPARSRCPPSWGHLA